MNGLFQGRQTVAIAHTSGARNGEVFLGKRATAFLVVVLLVAFFSLLAIRITSPWQYMHDDNGAWFSAIARTHVLRGVTETKGQDFFLVRETGELRPYLHHPPFIGLYLASVFKITGSSSPVTARVAVAGLHAMALLLFLSIGKRLLHGLSLSNAWALLVFAIAPMSVFFGKMPNHEVPGLLFLELGIWLSLRFAQAGSRSLPWRLAVFFAWLCVPFTSWHATLCGFAFVCIFATTMPPEQRRTFLWVSCSALLGALFLVFAQLLWANGWQLLPSQKVSTAHWLQAPKDTSWFSFQCDSLQMAAKHGRRFYADIPWALSLVWVAWTAIDAIRRRAPLQREIIVLALFTGPLLYCLLFARAVSIHAYQQFYFLPFVAVASALVVSRLYAGLQKRRKAVAVLLVVILAVLTVRSSLRRLRSVYREPAPYAVEATRSINAQFY